MLEIFTNIRNINNTPTQSLRFAGQKNVGFFSTTEPRKDSFNTNPLYSNFSDKKNIQTAIDSSSEIKYILNENNIPAKINMQALEELKSGHLMQTRILAAKIYSALPKHMKEQVNLMDLQQAAILHDVGKVLIPEKILNKKSSLTPEEKHIMELHPTIGYELLKQKGVKPEVLKLVKYHHQTPLGNGYPDIGSDFEPTLEMQILQVADKYSALTEQRSYKPAFPKDEALKILYEDTEKGIVAPEIYDALAKII